MHPRLTARLAKVSNTLTRRVSPPFFIHCSPVCKKIRLVFISGLSDIRIKLTFNLIERRRLGAGVSCVSCVVPLGAASTQTQRRCSLVTAPNCAVTSLASSSLATCRPPSQSLPHPSPHLLRLPPSLPSRWREPRPTQTCINTTFLAPSNVVCPHESAEGERGLGASSPRW